ncbi:methylated-DNA--[protein]-cysteine S-methyltransferase [Proteinivorax tanatarense]|uniref:Methylated-DNA--protein-cysteine methyltransferase n=1 Tax=Proteinivorax tanatarense TaxID=1260629 RepID=A0AAU7VJL4_9FIRM
MYYKIMDSPLGDLILIANKQALHRISFEKKTLPTLEKINTPILQLAEHELQKYFKGSLKVFSVPIFLHGSNFQVAVWNHLKLLPYGKTTSYGEVAKAIGNPKAVRAVGQANNKNPIPIIIPCHRVIGKNGSLTGYSGKMENKRTLLKFEGIKP